MEARERLITATSAAILPLGLDGHPLHDRQEQIRTVVERRLGRRHASLLAEAERRPGTDITDWYSDAPGTAVAAASMGEAQRTRLRTEIDAMLADIDRLGGELEAAKTTGARAAGRHLRLAARRPADDTFLYRVGAQPVLVAWGHDDTRPPVKVAPPVAAVAAVAVATPTIAVAETPPPEAQPRDDDEKTRGAFPWWLIAAGLAMFLAGLGIGWVLARFMPPTVVHVADEGRRAPPATAVPQRERDRLGEEAEKLRATLASLRGEFEQRRALCPPPPVVKPQEERVVCTRPPRRGRMVVVFDTSNSMGLPTANPDEVAEIERRWGAGDPEGQRRGMELVRGPGHKRIDDARAAALDLVEATPPNIDVGLITFLTRCDVGVAVRPTDSRDDVKRELREVTPRASTPLAASLRLAASQLSNDPATAAAQSIVVITDGAEGCGGDPCAAARDLKATFPSVKVHIIDVVGVSRLRCVADITGGSSVGARDTEQLRAAVRRAQASIEQDACR
jgi:hypothetical protein